MLTSDAFSHVFTFFLSFLLSELQKNSSIVIMSAFSSSSILRPRGGLSLTACVLVGLVLCQLMVTMADPEPEARRGRSRSRGRGKVAKEEEPANRDLDMLDEEEPGASREEKRKFTTDILMVYQQLSQN